MSFRTLIDAELAQTDRRFLVVALTGSIGSGKSTAADRFAHNGATIIDADILARRVVEPGSPGLVAVEAHFGRDVIAPNGSLNRKRLGEIVFAAPEERRWLEATLHPLIRGEFERELHGAIERANRTAPAPNRQIIIYVVPLLFEANLPLTDFDYVVVVALDRGAALNRLVSRDTISPAEAERRLNAQLPIEHKTARADIVIENRGTREDLHRAVDGAWNDLVGRPPRAKGP